MGDGTNRVREVNELNGVRPVRVGYRWSAEEARERRHQLEEAVLRLAPFVKACRSPCGTRMCRDTMEKAFNSNNQSCWRTNYAKRVILARPACQERCREKADGNLKREELMRTSTRWRQGVRRRWWATEREAEL